MNIIIHRGNISFIEGQPDASTYPVGTIGRFNFGYKLRIIKRSSRMKHYWTNHYGAIPNKVKTALLLLGE